MKNLLDDIIMDKADKIVSTGVIIFSLICSFIYLGSSLKTNAPQVQEMVNRYEEGKELLEILPEKEKNFNSSDVTYGYTAFLMGVSVEEIQSICSEDEIKSLNEIALSLRFDAFTTQEELSKMQEKEYALKRFGLDDYSIIYEIVQAHK